MIRTLEVEDVARGRKLGSGEQELRQEPQGRRASFRQSDGANVRVGRARTPARCQDSDPGSDLTQVGDKRLGVGSYAAGPRFPRVGRRHDDRRDSLGSSTGVYRLKDWKLPLEQILAQRLDRVRVVEANALRESRPQLFDRGSHTIGIFHQNHQAKFGEVTREILTALIRDLPGRGATWDDDCRLPA